jgi:hypothetical protein
LENPAIPPSLWNLFRENNLSGKSRNRAGGIILSAKGSAMLASQRLDALSHRQSNRPLQMRAKKNPSPMKEMGLL